MDKRPPIPLPPVVPALAEDLAPHPRRSRKGDLTWLPQRQAPEPADSDPGDENPA